MLPTKPMPMNSPILTPVQAAIFDMDGLVLDTEPIYRTAWQQTATEMGFHLSDTLYLDFIGRKEEDCVTILAQMWGEGFSPVQFRTRAEAVWQQLVGTFGILTKPGLYELLAELERQSIPKAIATSTERDKALQSLGKLAGKFEAIATGDEVRQGKPAPDIFLLAAQRLQVAPELCLVLEDAEAGIQAARAASMSAIMIPDLLHPSDHTIPLCPSLHAVKDLLIAL
jgi:HAD superfamily hydrolase (TIGR01509 family)